MNCKICGKAVDKYNTMCSVCSGINQALLRMGHTRRSKTNLLLHGITEETINVMLEREYIIEENDNDDIYYVPTEKSKEIW